MEELKALLKKQKVSYRKLSAVTGIPLTTLNGKMQGQYKFSVDEMVAICDAIGEDPGKVWKAFLCGEKEKQTVVVNDLPVS